MKKIYVLLLFINVLAVTGLCGEKGKLEAPKKRVIIPLSELDVEKQKKEAFVLIDRAINSVLSSKGNPAILEKFKQWLTTGIPERQKKNLLRDYFFAKIKKNQKKHIEFLVTHVDPTLLKTMSKKSQMPLITAIRSYALDVAQYLIDKTTDINQMDRRGRTPLIEAIKKLPTSVDYLLNRQADPNQADGAGITPLIVAINSKNSALGDSLVSWGAKMDQPDSEGNLPLVVAIANKEPKIALYLIKRGADLNKADANGITPLLAAINTQAFDLVKQLDLRGAIAHEQEIKAARQLGDQEILKQLSISVPEKKKSKFLFWRK